MIRFQCNSCKKVYEYPDNELDYDCVSSDERQMGTENEYSGTFDFECEKCNNPIIVEFNFWEYPQGALNYSDYTEEGCVVLEQPNYQSFLNQNENYEDF